MKIARRKLVAVLMLIIMLVLGGLLYKVYTENEELMEELNKTQEELGEAQAELAKINLKLSVTKEDLSISNETKDIYKGLSLYLADNFDLLDLLVGKNDDSNLYFIEWMIENATFFGDDISTANYLYGSWLSERKSHINEYDEIKLELFNRLDLLEEALTPEPDNYQNI